MFDIQKLAAKIGEDAASDLSLPIDLAVKKAVESLPVLRHYNVVADQTAALLLFTESMTPEQIIDMTPIVSEEIDSASLLIDETALSITIYEHEQQESSFLCYSVEVKVL